MALVFDQSPPGPAGELVAIAPRLRRIVAHNPSPFTFTGTCTYIVGDDDLTIIDPGPADAVSIDALIAALKGERIGRILVTHTHLDHSPGARLLQARTGAPIIGCGPHRTSRALLIGETSRLDASADLDHAPERILQDGDVVEAGDHRLRAVATPGHTANHLAFAWEETGMLFSGDHVMAWSTSIVAPPDGAMAPYLASLEKLIAREDDQVYWPGHGGPVKDPRRFTRALLNHRRQRETQIVERLKLGAASIPELVAANYPGLKPVLMGAAGLSVFAHLECLIEAGIVHSDGPASLEGRYALA